MPPLFTLIDDLNAHPHRYAELETQIWQQFGCYKTVLALDMSGFSLTVRRDGIVSYLAKIRKMQQLTVPLVHDHQGELVKCEADNLMAVFDDANHALDAAIAMSVGCKRIGQAVSIGLDYGRILLVPHQDCFGDAVNKAYKLGEDIARANEILLTDNVKNLLNSSSNYTLVAQHISVSGVDIDAYHVHY